MTFLPWLLVIVLIVVIGWLLLALAGASRTIASLRVESPVDLDGSARHLSTGLPAGTIAPPIDGIAEDLRGSRHIVTFVDPDCAACDELVPALIRAAHERRVPQTVLISRGAPADHPATWREASDRSRLLIEGGSELTNAYGVDVTPTAFVVDEGGLVVASGPTATIQDVLSLVDDVQGVRIAPGTERDPEVARGSS